MVCYLQPSICALILMQTVSVRQIPRTSPILVMLSIIIKVPMYCVFFCCKGSCVYVQDMCVYADERVLYACAGLIWLLR